VKTKGLKKMGNKMLYKVIEILIGIPALIVALPFILSYLIGILSKIILNKIAKIENAILDFFN
jgi:hypothetical protein